MDVEKIRNKLLFKQTIKSQPVLLLQGDQYRGAT